MKVLELLDEIEEIVDTASGIPLSGKIMVDSNELLEIVKEIRTELPEEIQQARWIKNERDRILGEAKNEYETIIRKAEEEAEDLDFQEKMDQLSSTYFQDMFGRLEMTFNEVNATLASNRDEIKEMAYKTSMNLDDANVQMTKVPSQQAAPESDYDAELDDDME